jgi:hypothetical protein
MEVLLAQARKTRGKAQDRVSTTGDGWQVAITESCISKISMAIEAFARYAGGHSPPQPWMAAAAWTSTFGLRRTVTCGWSMLGSPFSAELLGA